MIAVHTKITTDILRDALQFYELGWSIIPIKAGTKKPACKWKQFQTQRATIGQVEDWFSESDHGIAVIFGTVSNGLASIDFDNEGLYEMWKQSNRITAQRLPTVKTPRGYHVYFKLSDGQRESLRREFNSTGNGAISFDDGELRFGKGCYSVLPPSIHPDGERYKWLNSFVDAPSISDEELSCLVESFTQSTTQDNPRDPSNSLHVSHFEETTIFIGFVNSTQPTGFGQRNRKIFDFVRCLKSIPELRDSKPKLLKPYVREWHQKALPFIRTKEFEETWQDFVIAWENVKYEIGAGSIVKAVQLAKQNPYPPEADEYENPKTQFLVALCKQLQIISGGKTFFLSVRSIEEHIGIPKTTAAMRLKILIADDVIKLVKKGTKQTGNASKYRYLGRGECRISE